MNLWNKKKHRALEEEFDHYICERCMQIGANVVIKEFIKDLEDKSWYFSEYVGLLDNCDIINEYDDLAEKWKKRIKDG